MCVYFVACVHCNVVNAQHTPVHVGGDEAYFACICVCVCVCVHVVDLMCAQEKNDRCLRLSANSHLNLLHCDRLSLWNGVAVLFKGS